MLKLAWLGPPAAEVDRAPIRFETRKVTALLAYLSLNSIGIPREKLAALFWPEFDQTHAMANLRRALGSLIASLPPGSIKADRETIRWSEAAPLELDVHRLRAAIQAVRSHPHGCGSICAACIETLETAVALYRGDFLDGLNLPDCPAFDDWQYLTREELKREYAWALENLAAGLAAQAAWEKAASVARCWIGLDRLEAQAQLALVEIYARAGQRSLAQRQVEEYQRLFKEAFGQEPDEATRKLFQGALAPALAPALSAALAPALAPALSAPHPLEPERAQINPPAAAQVLLKTKLYLPKVKPSRVDRPRLLLKLNEIYQHKLSLVSAPAGFGKTSLLAEWAIQAESALGWLSLDGGDNDPHRFLSYLCAALDSLQEGLTANAWVLLESTRPPAPQDVITVLLKDLEGVSQPLVLVLDDYQFITAQSIHDALGYFLERSGPNLHLVIASRTDPPLLLARMRASGELLEVRTADLRFTLDECIAFFNQVMLLDITPADIQALAARTEGWAVGLQMAALSLQGVPDRAQFIRTFSGSHRYILDYLIQEVLDRQPEHVRHFLLKTSILDRLCSDLCEAILGESAVPAAAILDYLERSNLFLIPLDHECCWYRYHHLFADLLSSQLQRLQPANIQELHLRASAWYERSGQIDLSIEHALAARDFERMGELVEKDAHGPSYQSEFARMQRWIEQLPPEMVLQRAWIATTQAWLWLVAGKLPLLASWMDRVEQNYHTLWVDRYTETDRQDLLANIKSLRAYMAFFSGDVLKCIELARQGLHIVSPENEILRVRLLLQTGESYLAIYDLPTACDFLSQAIELGVSIRDYQTLTTAAFRLYRALQLLGKLNQAEAMLHKTIQALSDAGRMCTPVAGKLEICWGDLLRLRNQASAAREWLDRGLLHSQQYNIPFDTVTAMVHKAKWFFSRRLWEQALQQIDQALPLLKAFAAPPPIAFAWGLWRAHVCLEMGDLPAVETWVESLDLTLNPASLFVHEDGYILLARLHQRKADHPAALALLGKLAAGAEAAGRNGNLISILILQAISLDALGSRDAALDHLEKCLALAQPEGYLAPIFDAGPPVHILLDALRARRPSGLEDLLTAFEQYVEM